jgi:hypothetical protein
MVLEEGEGSLEKVAVEIFEREREGISEVVSWLLGLYLFVCREVPQSDSTLLSVDVYPLALAAIVFRRRDPWCAHTESRLPSMVQIPTVAPATHTHKITK